MPRAQTIRSAVEVASKIFNCMDVGTYGILRIITTLEILQHHFFQMGHGNTSCDPHLHPSHQATNARSPHAQRPPPGGYVLTRLPSNLILASVQYLRLGSICLTLTWSAPRSPLTAASVPSILAVKLSLTTNAGITNYSGNNQRGRLTI